MANWFVSINGEQKGPYPTDQLRQLVSDGLIPRDSYVWREGMAQWQVLSQVRISDDASPAAPVQPQLAYSQQQSYSSASPMGATQSQTFSGDVAGYVKPGYFSFTGRISRQTFWINYVLLPMIVIAIISVVGGVLSQSMMSIGEDGNIHMSPVMYALIAVAAVAYILLIVASLSGQVKRLHDRGRSGWFVLLSLVPIANIWILIEVAFLKGTAGPNEYGPDPVG
jgi:uncharacterized membrane protein YhaH (DUF805 family)